MPDSRPHSPRVRSLLAWGCTIGVATGASPPGQGRSGPGGRYPGARRTALPPRAGRVGGPAAPPPWCTPFPALGDPARLRLLLCIRAARPTSVPDLAVAASLSDTTT